MSQFVSKTFEIQNQMKRLFWTLGFASVVAAALLTHSFLHLNKSYLDLGANQKRVARAANLVREFAEQSQLSGAASQSDHRALVESKKRIKGMLDQMSDEASMPDEKEAVDLITHEWSRSKTPIANHKLLFLTKEYVDVQTAQMKPAELAVQRAIKATFVFGAVYLIIFIFSMVLFNNFMKRRVFAPLSSLTDKMAVFETGKGTAPTITPRGDEMGVLETQFGELATRIDQQMNQLKELDKAKTDFISIASHELRTPMTALKGSLSLILSGAFKDIAEEIKELLVIAEKETDRLIRLINDILDLTKMEAKKMPLNKHWHNLDEIVEAAAKGLVGLCEVTKVSIDFQPPMIPLKINVDSDRIQQVVTNLLSNAMKFSPPNSSVKVSYCNKEGSALVMIEDQGPGISFDVQNRMFEKFRSLDNGSSKVIRGTGLGLPICKAIVEQHLGHIGVQSEPGHGSTFYFTIPGAMATTRNIIKTEEGQIAA